MADYMTHHSCRACRGDLVPVLDLGDLRLNGFPETPTGHLQVLRAPLRLMVCRSCTLVQLGESVAPDLLYRHYWYRSSVNESMRTELSDVVRDGLSRVAVHKDLRVLDIGANDGTLLASYPKGTYRIGIDPSTNLQGQLATHCDQAICGYFPQAFWDIPRNSAEERQGFDLITAIACCYDLEDPVAFFQGIGDLLRPEGLACVQFQDLLQQIQAQAFDNICHEHLEYYSLTSLWGIVEAAGLRVVDVAPRAINGGSLRVWLAPAHQRARRYGPIAEQLEKEAQAGLGPTRVEETLRGFARSVQCTLRGIRTIMGVFAEAGVTVDLYGASTKGNILLQLAEIGPAAIRWAIDRDPTKAGRFTITGIPIVDETQAAGLPPAAVWLIPIWQFKQSVLARNLPFIEGGGTLFFPLPRPELYVHGRVEAARV